MSHFPPDKMGFYDAIQLFFMELTGRALMFSGRDLEVLSRWRSDGATVAVVCKGIEDAFRAMDRHDPPRNVYGCRQYVEPLVEQARKMAAGRHDPAQKSDEGEERDEVGDKGGQPAVVRDAMVAIERAGKRASTETLKAVYRDAWRRLKAMNDDGAETFEALAAVEQALAEGYFAALDAQEREAIEARIARESAGLAMMSEEAREEHRAARRRLVLIRDYGMATLWT